MGNCCRMTTMDGNVTWMKLTHLSSFFSSSLRAFFCETTYASKLLIALLSLHTRKNHYLSFMYTMYANALKNTPYYNHISS